MQLKGFRRILYRILERCAPIIPDIMYLHMKYFLRIGKPLRLKNPQTFNEKLQWLKQYGRRPIDTTFTDKYAAKELVSSIIGSQYIIPTLGVWNSFDEIDFSSLPDQFVLKCTHDSGGVVVCTDKSTLDFAQARAIIERGMKRNFYVYSREKVYKDIPRKIIAETYMEDSKTGELRDYKFLCFHGIPKILFIVTDRKSKESETKYDFFDMDFNHLPFTNGDPCSTILPSRPINFDEMKTLAAKLSKDIPHVRVDFYEVNGKIYFGEMTYSHAGGMDPFNPESWDYLLGSWINLPEKHIK